MRMHVPTPVRLYCEATFAVAVAALALLSRHLRFGYISAHPLTFAALAICLALGELLPIKVPRRGGDEELTLSAGFALALLIAGGLGPALIAQSAASILQDCTARKPLWRARFNVGQYALSMLAAWIVIRTIVGDPRLDALRPFASRQLPAVMLGAAAFFLVNAFVVGSAVALHQHLSIPRYFRTSVSFVLVTGGVVLLVAPIVLAAAMYAIVIVPLCLAPVIVMYQSVSQAARSDYAARHDPLTGLPNRTAFQEAVADAITTEGALAAVLLLDLDRFKEVNDTLGHRYGDMLLVQVAQRFQQVIGTSGQISRLGGDEFAVVCPRSDALAAQTLARRIADSLGSPFELEDTVVDTQASIGVAMFPEHGRSDETLLAKADVAMYHAKAAHMDVAIYDERHDHHSAAKLGLVAELRAAIDSGEIVVFYQPIIELRSHAVVAVEALVRWRHPRLGLLLPGAFLHIAEATDLIRPLTARVLHDALAQIKAWQQLGLDLAVAVNISAYLLTDVELPARVERALRLAGVSADRLKLEVTESALMSDPELAREVLVALERLGCRISIDDFGTGYSSLAYLAELPACEVKIDRAFVSRIDQDTSGRIIVSSTVDLAHNLEMGVVAEGVEDPAALGALGSLGCDTAQGYAISHPLAAGAATAWLTATRDAAASGATRTEPQPAATPERRLETIGGAA